MFGTPSGLLRFCCSCYLGPPFAAPELSLRATLDIVTDMLVNARDLADIMTAFGENLSQHKSVA